MKFLVLVFLLVACTPKKIQGPDGRMFYAIKCYETKVDCYRKATKVCGEKGYTIIDEQSNQTLDDRAARSERAAKAFRNQNAPSAEVTINNQPALQRTQFTLLYDCK